MKSVVVAFSKQDLPKHACVRGPIEGHCALCHAVILLAPSSVSMIKAGHVEARCIKCAKLAIDETTCLAITQEQVKEFKEFVKQEDKERTLRN